jgi:hypothetical protein
MEINKNHLNSILDRQSYQDSGDSNEKTHYHCLINEFPNSENFWKYFVVPLTERINSNPTIRKRDGVTNDIYRIATLNYTIFLNFAYANTHTFFPVISSFENFYSHLGTICDLSEDLILNFYLLLIECNLKDSLILSKLSKTEFLQLASLWYDQNYENLYVQYFKSGKAPPIRLPNRKLIVEEYLSSNLAAWKDYVRFSQLIREFRNVIVHDTQIGIFYDQFGNRFVPKKEKIQQYKTWDKIFEATQDHTKLQRDFINRSEQMNSDFILLQRYLNALWNILIADFKQLFFDEENSFLLEKYNLTYRI